MGTNNNKRWVIGTVIFFLIVGFSVRGNALTPDEENNIKVFREAADSVVFVTNQKVVNYYDMRAEKTTEIPRGSGSGFIWDKRGYIVTNYHVIQGGDSFYVTLRDQSRHKATLVGYEERKDMAVLKIDKSKIAYELSPIKIGTVQNLQVGQKALAIGNPYGLDHSLTIGIISALDRQINSFDNVTIREVIQTDASINPGNSGGPLLDSSGLLIGMNAAIFSESGGSAGIGFAIPVTFITRLVPQIIQYGKVTQPDLGVNFVKGRSVEQIHGAVVGSLDPSSAAYRAGLRGVGQNNMGETILGDVITEINNIKIESYDDLYNALDHMKVGDTVRLKVVRQGKEYKVKLTLQKL